MTPDQLRTGAALVRCLVEGDETARGPLSDFVEEFGLPNAEHRLYVTGATNFLRGKDPICSFTRYPSGTVLLIGRDKLPECWLGTWPAWAWDGREPTSATEKEVSNVL